MRLRWVFLLLLTAVAIAACASVLKFPSIEVANDICRNCGSLQQRTTRLVRYTRIAVASTRKIEDTRFSALLNRHSLINCQPHAWFVGEERIDGILRGSGGGKYLKPEVESPNIAAFMASLLRHSSMEEVLKWKPRVLTIRIANRTLSKALEECGFPSEEIKDKSEFEIWWRKWGPGLETEFSK